MANWLLVDGYNLAFRSFYAVRGLSRSDGFPTNALYGWTRSLWKMSDDQRPDHVVVFLDLGGAQNKLALLPEYKAQREETPEDFEKQIPVIKEITAAMGYPIVEEDGVESDDLLAAYAHRLRQREKDAVILIVSADKDFAQCVNDRVRLLLPPPTANPRLGWRELDAEGVKRKHGVPPAKIPDLLALVGDVSDNIPGVPGVGPKTAAKWILEYGDLDGVLAHAGELKPPRFREILPEWADRLAVNRQIIALDLTCGSPEPEEGRPDPKRLFEILEEMEMKTHLQEAKRRYAQGELNL